jgi:flagellar biogenesis protein FliO
MQYGLALIAVIAVIAAAYYVTYLIGTHGNRAMNGRLIRIRERFALSRDKMLCVAEFNGKLYLIALTNNGAELLDKIEASELAPIVAATAPSFAEALKKAWENRKGGGA